jgi:hypothetical protein
MSIGVVVCFGVIVLWQLAVVAILRTLGIRLPFSRPFRFYMRKEPELLEVQEGWTESTYILIAGFLMLTCPLFAGLIAYDYIERRCIQHSSYDAASLVGLAVVFMLLVFVGRWKSVNDWKRLSGDSLR